MPLPFASLMLPSTPVSASASASADFGIHLRGLHARCLRFVATVTRVLLYGHARLASSWRPCLSWAGVEPAGLQTRFHRVFGFT